MKCHSVRSWSKRIGIASIVPVGAALAIAGGAVAVATAPIWLPLRRSYQRKRQRRREQLNAARQAAASHHERQHLFEIGFHSTDTQRALDMLEIVEADAFIPRQIRPRRESAGAADTTFPPPSSIPEQLLTALNSVAASRSVANSGAAHSALGADGTHHSRPQSRRCQSCPALSTLSDAALVSANMPDAPPPGLAEPGVDAIRREEEAVLAEETWRRRHSLPAMGGAREAGAAGGGLERTRAAQEAVEEAAIDAEEDEDEADEKDEDWDADLEEEEDDEDEDDDDDDDEWTEGDKVLQVETMNQRVVKMQYAVRGQVPTTAELIQTEINNGQGNWPFDEVLFCNIGNPHSVGQKPITFYRQVLALVDCPWLLDDPRAKELFPADAIERARYLSNFMTGGTGAYSHSQGVLAIRKTVASFIEQRDGYSCDPNNIFLTNGASTAIQMVLTALINSPSDAVLVPMPQYPIYSALLSLLNGKMLGYHMDENRDWALDVSTLEKQVAVARDQGLRPKAVVVINPGNPVGNVLTQENMREIAEFCKKEGLLVLADEVYQENVYGEKPFVSFKKAIRDLGPDFDDFELASFHSTSKGLTGECGRRGGYMELVGVDAEVQGHIIKLASSGLCSCLNGQIMVDLMLNPPCEGDVSYPLWKEETETIYKSLHTKSQALYHKLNSMEGISVRPLEGAMYAFPKIEIPERAIAKAHSLGLEPDTFYALSLLEATGICTVPGSGFGQKKRTYHVRMTFLPEEKKLMAAMDRFEQFHKDFLAQYS
mmetsp:Transcript_16723/g.40349  ORF Transcript_16723/g.40349 Transcript_16723/m.40349 type:complete len:771 (+) Transcript_16723:2-2314(+)